MLTSFARAVTRAMVSAACNCRAAAPKGSARDGAMDSITSEGGTYSITGAGGGAIVAKDFSCTASNAHSLAQAVGTTLTWP